MVAYTVADDDVSPFEMIHSGVIDTLTTYLHASPQVPSTSTTLNDLVRLEQLTWCNKFLISDYPICHSP